MPRKRKIKGLKETPFLILIKDFKGKYTSLILKLDEEEKKNSSFNYYAAFEDSINEEYDVDDFFVFELSEKQKKKISEKSPKFAIFLLNGEEDIIDLLDIETDYNKLYKNAEHYLLKHKKEIDELNDNYELFDTLIRIDGEEYDEENEDEELDDELEEGEEYGECFIMEE